MTFDKRKKNDKEGPVFSKEGVPYDYIIIIDAGSKGSRVYVYNWLNPTGALEAGIDLHKYTTLDRVKMVRRFDVRDEGNTIRHGDGGDSSSDDDSDSDEELLEEDDKSKVLLPKIQTKEKWHKKITPGISSFEQNPKKIGKQHLYHLLKRASQVVPKSQHHRTPIFLHATAGMRLLNPTERGEILDNICEYFTTNSDFYIPDCSSHVNVIHGEEEGIYGWMSINSIMGSFDNPEEHQHGDDHFTYGLLDMGGASTQVVFQPNTTEVEEHQKNLYHILLNKLPEKDGSQFLQPNPMEFNVYSDSFLGFGMSEARNLYYKYLRNKFNEEQNIDSYPKITSSIPDPCLPKGYVTSQVIDDHSYDFSGESNFNECLNNIFPVLKNSTHGAMNCNPFNETDKSSSCLLNESIPAFDFDVNHFAAVSGYWNAIEDLISYLDKRDKQDQKNTYDYKIIYGETEKVCSSSYSHLLGLNEGKSEKGSKMSDEDLSELCFRSSWILNFLHLGLGFPRFGIDEVTNTSVNGFESLQMIEKLGGTKFSWTLGRAILYANDEYVQAYNNFTTNLTLSLKRPGYYHRSSESLYHYGAEQSGIPPRPEFVEPRSDETYTYYDYEKANAGKLNGGSSGGNRWYGMFAFSILIFLIGWLMIGSTRRRHLIQKVRSKFASAKNMTPGYNSSKYVHLGGSNDDLENGYELDDMVSSSSSTNIDHQFMISDEDEDVKNLDH